MRDERIVHWRLTGFGKLTDLGHGVEVLLLLAVVLAAHYALWMGWWCLLVVERPVKSWYRITRRGIALSGTLVAGDAWP